MAYIETLKRGKKNYYYLTKNIRISQNKWKKVRIYLGDKKPSDKEINKLAGKIEKKAAKEGLANSKFLYLKSDDAETLQDLKESYNEWLRHIPKSLQKKLDDDFLIRFTYNSNAIEGNRLTLRQTALILKDKVIPSGVRAQDYNEAINGKECLDYLKSYKGELNNTLLEKINGILTKNTGVIYSGRIRFFDVRIDGSKHIPPKYQEVKKHLLNLMKWYSANKNKMHPFELAAIIHGKIAWIHPFEDGNGRTARAIMNFILMKKGYPMFFIPVEKIEKYYKALDIFDKNEYRGYVFRMLKLIIDQVRSYGHNKPKR
ncbi:Fic family protein [Candidatus Woesearchaeota archaeon]|nr:Fic family protein [Candidatus Woesearchaeota archaeon]